MNLAYGKSVVEISGIPRNLEILSVAPKPGAVLTDVEIGERLDRQIDSPHLDELISSDDRVLLVVPDATRLSGAGVVSNLLVRRLIASGVAPHNIAAIFANGIHRAVTDDEKKEILTPFLAQRLRTFNHNASDLMKLAGLDSTNFSFKGITSQGIEVHLNKVLDEYDKIISIGAVGFHYFAGYSGGRKLICPGLASQETISETHRLAFDFDTKRIATGVGSGMLDGNPVHQAFMECVSMAPPTFSINTLVDGRGDVEDLFCGDWISSHRQACRVFGERNTIQIDDRREVVVVSCGGAPWDLNLIQAHKSLDAAAEACIDGGTIVFIAECAEGLGRNDFLKWFSHGGSSEIAEKLCREYEINGQTAWNLRSKTERFDVRMITSLSPEAVHQMGMSHHGTFEDAFDGLDGKSGYIIPMGHKTLIKTK